MEEFGAIWESGVAALAHVQGFLKRYLRACHGEASCIFTDSEPRWNAKDVVIEDDTTSIWRSIEYLRRPSSSALRMTVGDTAGPLRAKKDG